MGLRMRQHKWPHPTDMMDYKYIEQLIDRYFEDETTLEEEHILREFFAQKEVPEHLRQWQPLFAAQRQLASAHLDEAFDQRLLAMVGEPHVKARRITLSQRIYPLYKAAAVVAVAIVVGTAVEHAAGTSGEDIRTEQMATGGQDELDENETTTIDIKSAEATEQLTDSLLPASKLPPQVQ